MNKKYIVRLTDTERGVLEGLVNTGKGAARTLTHARILLKADCGPDGPAWTDPAISAALDVSIPTIERVRRTLVLDGFDAALERKPAAPRPRKLDGHQEAQLIALACTTAPEGHKRWTLKLLAKQLVELEDLDGLAPETVRQILKKTELKPWLNKEWCIPPKANAAFVAQMEDVLDVYTRPVDPKHPLVCFDESSKQQVKEVRVPVPVAPGHPARFDTEYERNGVSNLFMFFCPLLNWRHVKVTDHRTAVDWAQCMRELVDVHFPDAERITLVQDNLNTHTAAALYATFEPAEAKRIWDKLDVHYTPKHGSWLNMAEIELSVLSRQCLDRRIPAQETLISEVAAWEVERNGNPATVNWRYPFRW